ncbi:MAG: hypothetical protein G01um101429_468 [Parcubacteria group bacterium Gr01-1014_29]|nr:MAG: hypothetical protein G01um101429_468 [Parcubacteria group bacterium Gr01-1014_29]
MKAYRGIIFVIVVSVLASVATAYWNGTLFQTSFTDWSDDSQYYNARALSLLHTGSLGEDQAQFRRPPAYPLFLAAIYGVFGERIAVAWVANIALFSLSLFLLWWLALQWLVGMRSYVVPLLCGLYGGFHYYVFSVGSEMLSVFLLLVLLFFLLRYRESQEMRYLILFGVAGGALALTKPIFLYAVPILLGGIAYQMRQYKGSLRHAGVAFAIVLFFVGGWAARTYALFGELQTERSGHIVYTRALYGTLSLRDAGIHLLASVTNDYVADQLFPGYGDDPVATRLGVMRITAFRELRADGYENKEIERILFGRGVSEAMRHPLMFAAGAVPLLFDLNTPENFNGFPVTRMFVGTRNTIAPWQKIAIVLGIRAMWFFFLAVVVTGMIRAARTALPNIGPLVFLVAFANISHAFLIIPPEPRFLVPVLPLYVMFFVMGARAIVDKLSKKSII